MGQSIPLSGVLPPLICGTATFNSQYNHDPYALSTNAIVQRAFSLGIRAFDTSPYYGPAEDLLGAALDTDSVKAQYTRKDYFILTKVGRLPGGTDFDYRPEWVQQSVARSLKRLRTTYLDVVYCHDVEFVTPAEVLTAVQELRHIRDMAGAVRYIGISGYPVDILGELSEMILRETGEPLDAVMSYANYTLQNTLLSSEGLSRLSSAKVDVILNASPLGMGLLRRQGVPIGGGGDFHPAEDGLRSACRKASDYCDSLGEKLEVVALHFALEGWLGAGATSGSRSGLAPHLAMNKTGSDDTNGGKAGVSVIGVSSIDELDETMRLWKDIVYDPKDDELLVETEEGKEEQRWHTQRKAKRHNLARDVREILDRWLDYTWASPGVGFVKSKEERESHNKALLRSEDEQLGLLTPKSRSQL